MNITFKNRLTYVKNRTSIQERQSGGISGDLLFDHFLLRIFQYVLSNVARKSIRRNMKNLMKYLNTFAENKAE